jgi:hypothetical protein
MLLGIVAALGMTLDFPGGGVTQLSDLLSKTHGKPVAILALSSSDLAQFKVATDDPFVFSTRVFKATGFKAPKNGTGYAPLAWPPYMLGTSRFGRASIVWGNTKLDSWNLDRKGDAVKVAREGSGLLRVSDLQTAELGKPLRMPYFYGQAVVGLSTGSWTTRQMLQAVAEATGALLVETRAEYRFKFNPKTFRERTARALTEEIGRLEHANSDPVHTMQARLMEQTFGFLTDKQLELLFEGKESELLVEVNPRSPINAHIFRYLDAYVNRKDVANMNKHEYQMLVNRMDFDRPIKLHIDAGSLKVSVQAYDKETPNGGIRL